MKLLYEQFILRLLRGYGGVFLGNLLQHGFEGDFLLALIVYNSVVLLGGQVSHHLNLITLSLSYPQVFLPNLLLHMGNPLGELLQQPALVPLGSRLCLGSRSGGQVLVIFERISKTILKGILLNFWLQVRGVAFGDKFAILINNFSSSFYLE
jgi:hypothetical protein